MLYAFLIIGILLLASTFIVDDIYDGLVSALGTFFVSFGAIGLIASSVSDGDNIGATFFVVLTIVSVILAIATFFLFRALRRGAERAAAPVTIGDIVSSTGHVIWWSGKSGEVSINVLGDKRTVRAESEDELTAGENILVIRATSVNDVYVVRYN